MEPTLCNIATNDTLGLKVPGPGTRRSEEHRDEHLKSNEEKTDSMSVDCKMIYLATLPPGQE